MEEDINKNNNENPNTEKVDEKPDEKVDEKEIINIRKDKVISYLKKFPNYGYYLILAILVWLSIFLRTRNINGLKDVTTNDWTLAPDLDPYLFL